MQEEIALVVASKPVWQNMRAYRAVTNDPCSRINIELLLMSRFPLVLVVNIDDAVSTETCLICKDN
jgi:hypothetical protein